jgi:putative flippase GtrA
VDHAVSVVLKHDLAEKPQFYESPKNQLQRIMRLLARQFIAEHAKPRTRRWRACARPLGLRNPKDGDEPEVIKGGLCERWGSPAGRHLVGPAASQCSTGRAKAAGMIPIERFRAIFPRTTAMIEPHFVMLHKAVSFALIGLINVLIDTTVFLITYWYLNATPWALRPLDAFADGCACTSHASIVLIAANTMSWLVAVSCSYIMNSQITFAAESGRQLRWKSYGTFVASGVLGAVANTATLVVAARFMPVLAAKGAAILAGFFVNFTVSHFVVFRTRRPAEEDLT